MSAEAELAALGKSMLDQAAPPLVRFAAFEDDKSDVRVFVAARHDAVTEVLCDESVFSLHHYDELLEQVLPGTRYLVGDDDAARRVRLRQLHAAQAWLDARRGALASGEPPNMAPGFRDWIGAMAREEAHAILDVLQRRASTEEPVNFAREYAFLIAYRMARRFVGVPAPEKVPVLVRMIVMWRNTLRPGAWLRLKDELGDSVAMLVMLQPLFGHVFGTVIKSPEALQALCRRTAPAALKAIDQALAHPESSPEDSMLSALVAVKPQFAGVEDYDLQARSVLFELTGALVLIIGKSLCEIAAFTTSPAGIAAGITWDHLTARLADRNTALKDHDATINEALRLAGSSRLTRTVRADCQWRGIDLKAGDRIVVLIDPASRDPSAFAEPERFAPDPARAYITSGPLQGPHICYGRGIAWTIMREAIAATRGRIEPAQDAKVSVFAGLPDDLPFVACRR